MIARAAYDAVLFDLDGTLIDTAPEFIVALDRLMAQIGRAAPDRVRVGHAVSQGGSAMLRAALGSDEAPDPALLERFLALYAERLGSAARLYPGIAQVLESLERRGVAWGIVTNKPQWLTTPLLAALGLSERAAVVVCGDTLPTRKPDPAPVLYACAALPVAPARCLMIGDDPRDVTAAIAAGAIAVVADWGYTPSANDAWGAPFRAADGNALHALLDLVAEGDER